MGARETDRELERLIPLPGNRLSADNDASNTASPSVSPVAAVSPSTSAGKQAFAFVIRSWASKKFMTGCVILLPIAITFYITWWFIHFVDGFFSPIYSLLGIDVFGERNKVVTFFKRGIRMFYSRQCIFFTYGLGFVTSISFIFLVGVFMSSWVGASVLALGEWLIVKMPLVNYIYAASKQISLAISPDQSSQAFKEVAIIRHPHLGEYAFGFITSSVILRKSTGAEEVCCVYVPTNHLYLGDIFLINSKDIIRPNLSVRECIEIVISGGMSVPKFLTSVDIEPIRSSRVG